VVVVAVTSRFEVKESSIIAFVRLRSVLYLPLRLTLPTYQHTTIQQCCIVVSFRVLSYLDLDRECESARKSSRTIQELFLLACLCCVLVIRYLNVDYIEPLLAQELYLVYKVYRIHTILLGFCKTCTSTTPATV
jgi:hypothetical protein